MNFRKGSLIILLIILCCHRTTGHYEFLFLKDMENHPIYKTLKLKSEKQISAIIMLPNGEFNINEAREMIEQIDKLPGSLLTKMEKHRIKLIFFTGDLTSIPSLQSLKGIIPRGYAEASVTWDDVPGAGGSKKFMQKLVRASTGKDTGQ